MADVCAAFSVGQSTASAKARVISDALHAHRMDPAWVLPSLVGQNPQFGAATASLVCHRIWNEGTSP